QFPGEFPQEPEKRRKEAALVRRAREDADFKTVPRRARRVQRLVAQDDGLVPRVAQRTRPFVAAMVDGQVREERKQNLGARRGRGPEGRSGRRIRNTPGLAAKCKKMTPGGPRADPAGEWPGAPHGIRGDADISLHRCLPCPYLPLPRTSICPARRSRACS